MQHEGSLKGVWLVYYFLPKGQVTDCEAVLLSSDLIIPLNVSALCFLAASTNDQAS